MAIMPMLFCACSSFNEDNRTQSLITLPDLQANCADETRAYVENNKYLRWHEDDRLTAFYGNTLNRQYKFNGKTGDNSGTFSLVPSGELGTGNAFDCIYALYPYSETATITDEGVISLTLPAIQSYAENSFGRGANTMIAVTENLEDTFLSFKNACGYLKLKLYNADGAIIKSIELKGNNGEKIAGAATATIAFGEAPVVTMSEDASTSITLDCGDGVTLGTTAETATEFWVVVPEMTFTKGITITATDVDGGTFVKSASNKVVIERNTIQPMAEVEYKRTEPANNEIWYTSTDGNIVEPYTTEGWGANIVSNTYTNGQGIIKFDKAVSIIPTHAFRYESRLSTITLPNSVQVIEYRAISFCNKLESVYGKFASTDNRCFVVNEELIYVSPQISGEYTLPNNVTKLGIGSMFSFQNIVQITIPNSVTEIAKGTIMTCTTKVSAFKGKFVTEDGLSVIKDNVLYGVALYNLTSYDVPNGVVEMQDAIFQNAKLTRCTIPESMTHINGQPFNSCTRLQYLYCKANIPPTLNNNIFYDLTTIPNIYVPTESVDAYKSAIWWRKWADNIVGMNF